MKLRTMRWIAVCCLTSCLALAPALTGAAPARAQTSVTDAQRALAGSYLDAIHVDITADAWRKLLLAPTAFPDCGPGGDADQQAKMNTAWQRAVERGFDPAAFRGSLVDAFALSFSEQELKDLIALRESPLGRKMSLLEKRISERQRDDAKNLDALAQIEKSLRSNPLRKKRFEELMAATGGTEPIVDMMIAASLGTALGTAAATPSGQPRMSVDDITGLVEASRPGLRRIFQPIALYFYADTYSALSTDEVARAKDMMSLPVARKSTAIGLAASRAAMHAQAMRVGEAFARALMAQEV